MGIVLGGSQIVLGGSGCILSLGAVGAGLRADSLRVLSAHSRIRHEPVDGGSLGDLIIEVFSLLVLLGSDPIVIRSLSSCEK